MTTTGHHVVDAESSRDAEVEETLERNREHRGAVVGERITVFKEGTGGCRWRPANGDWPVPFGRVWPGGPTGK